MMRVIIGLSAFCMSKIFERQLKHKINGHFEKLSSKYLSGFRTNHICESVLLKIFENIKKYADKGKIVCVLLMYLSYAALQTICV